MTGHPLTPDHEIIHGTCVAIAGAGVLILGPPGAGKSDMALRLIDGPGCGISGKAKVARLVADDQVMVRRLGHELFASPPATIAGKLEIRGQGIVELPHASEIALRLCVRLMPVAGIARMPEPAASRRVILGIVLPLVDIDPLAPSAAARVRAAVDALSAP